MAKGADAFLATPEERMQRAVLDIAERAVATKQMEAASAATGAFLACFTIGTQMVGMTDKLQLQWMRNTVDRLEQTLEERKRFPPL
jgi:hypothetical protein